MRSLTSRFFYGWWVVFASASVILLSAGTFAYGFGTLVTPLTAEFGWSRAAISLGFSLRTEVGGVAAPVVGFLVDRVSPRLIMTTGVLVAGTGFILMSQVQSLWMFYAAIMFIAFGTSSTSSSAPNVAISRWFRRRRGRALGLMTLGGGISGVMALLLAWLIDSYGWRDALIITGVLQLVVGVPLALSIRNRPQDLGLEPDGVPPESIATPEGARLQHLESQGMTSKEALRSSVFWRVSLAMALSSFATTAVIVHQVPYLEESAGMSEAAAAGSVTAMTILSILGRLGLGSAADFLQNRVVMCVALVCIGVSLALFATVSSPWQLAYVLPLFGIGHGGVVPVRSGLYAQYFGLKALGSIQGLALTIQTIGGFLGPVIAGILYDSTDSYRLAFVMLGIAPLIGAPLILSARPPRWPDREDATTAPVSSGA